MSEKEDKKSTIEGKEAMELLFNALEEEAKNVNRSSNVFEQILFAIKELQNEVKILREELLKKQAPTKQILKEDASVKTL